MFSSSYSSSSSHFSSGMSASSIGSSSATNASSAKGIQSLEKRVVYTSKEEIEKRLASILSQVQQNQISSLDLTPMVFGEQKNSAIASASSLGSGGNSVHLLDFSSFSCLSNLTGHSQGIGDLAVLSNGTLASGSFDNTIKLWDTSSGYCSSTLKGHSGSVFALAVLSNGTLASGSLDNTIKLWDTSSGYCSSTLKGHSGSVFALAVLSNGSLASGSSDGTIKLWDTSSGHCLSTFKAYYYSVSDLAVLPNGDLASCSHLGDNIIKLWDTSSGYCSSTLKGHSSSVFALAVLPNGTLASGDSGGRIKLWDTYPTSHCLSTLWEDFDCVRVLAVLPNGSLASGASNGKIRLWDTSSGRCLATLRGHSSSVSALAVLPNGTFASGSGVDKTIKLWQPKKLDLTAQRISSILYALKSNTSVTALNLSLNCNISDDVIDPLIEIFTPGFFFNRKPNTTLKSIDLRHTGITQKAGQKLETEFQKINSTSAFTLLTDWTEAGRLKNEEEEKELKALQEAEAKRKAEIERQRAEEQRKKEEEERQLVEEKRRKEQAEREQREKVEREQAERRRKEEAERKAVEEKARAEKGRKDKLDALRLQVAQKEKEAADSKKKQEEEEEIRHLEAQMEKLASVPPPSNEGLVDSKESREQKNTSSSSSQSSIGRSGSSCGAASTLSASEIKELQASYLLPYECLTFGQALGEGGFGVVYQGTYRAGEVAIKKLLVKKMTTSCEEEFKNEISIMACSKHPNIVTLYGYTVAPHYCMVMEKMHTSLYSVLQNSSVELSWPMRTTIAMDIIAGLWQLHESGILHRDLKSLNVLLSSSMRAKLADFGLSKVKSETRTTTKNSEGSVGTVQWMAPELFGIKPKYSRASDIYAYAMVLWELVTRQIPYADANPQVVIAEVGTKGAREDIPSDCPVRFASLIKFCWAQDAAQRPSAKDIGIYWQSDAKVFKPTAVTPTGVSNLSSQVISNLGSLG